MEALLEKGSSNVAKSLKAWLSIDFDIKNKSFNSNNIKQLSDLLCSHKEAMVIYNTVENSEMLGLAFTVTGHDSALNMIDTIYKNELGTTKKLDAMGISAVKEMANLVSGKFINIIAEEKKTNINCTQPIVVDNEALQKIIHETFKDSSEEMYLIHNSEFTSKNNNLNICLYLILNKGLQEIIKK